MRSINKLLVIPGCNCVSENPATKQLMKQCKITLLNYMAAILYYLGVVNTWLRGKQSVSLFPSFSYKIVTKMLFEDGVPMLDKTNS